MNFRIIEYIDAIGRQGTMSGAARELFITSAALNQQLLKLERELGVQLFVRAKHRLIPTEAGEICLKGIRSMLDIWEETQSELQDVAGNVKGMRGFCEDMAGVSQEISGNKHSVLPASCSRTS